MQTSNGGAEIRTDTQRNPEQDASREAELIRRALDGQSEAFSELVTPHFKPLRGLVQKFVRNEFDCEDIMQQTVLKAYSRLDQFGFRATFRTWLSSIALNEIRQNGRSRNNSRLVFDGGKLMESATSDRGDSPFELYEREESAQRLHDAIRKLPVNYRVVIEVSDLNERSLSETRTALRLTSAAAKTRLFRARRRLGLLLAEPKKARVRHHAKAKLD